MRWRRGHAALQLAAALIADVGLAASDDEGTWLASRGVELEAVYTGEAMADVAGSAEPHLGFIGNLDLTLSLDFERLARWQGATLFVYGLANHGPNPSRHVGDAQGVSNIAAPRDAKLYEAWLQQELWALRASVLAGLYDLNSEFDVLESSTLFVNSSHGVDPTLSQSGTLGPSIFPHTALGVRAMFRPVAHLYGRLLVADAMAGNPSVSGETRVHLAAGDGALVVAELGTLASTGAGTSSNPHHFSTYRLGRLGGDEAAGKLALGVWHYTRRAARLEASAGAHEVRGRPGLYLIGEHVLGGLPGGARPSVFLRLGAADPRIYRFAGFVGTGVSTSGTFASRPQDAAGIALAVAINGDPYLRTERRAGRPVARAELNLEVTYAAELMRGLVAQADVQYVAHPDTDLRRSAAFVGGLRLELSL